MVATLSFSSLVRPPQTDDIRIQPNPSLETSGPFLPRAIFLIVVIVVILLMNNTKIGADAGWAIALTAQFTCLYGSLGGAGQRVFIGYRCANRASCFNRYCYQWGSAVYRKRR